MGGIDIQGGAVTDDDKIPTAIDTDGGACPLLPFSAYLRRL